MDELTDLQVIKNLYEELGWQYEILEHGYKIFLVRDKGFSNAEVREFFKRGEREIKIKGKRAYRRIYRNTKSRHFVSDGERIYF